MAATVVEVLESAKELIKTPDKWIKGTEYDHATGRMCMIGALRRTNNYFHLIMTLEDECFACHIERIIAGCISSTGREYGGIVNFNDDEAVTHDDVMQVFSCAIEKAKAKE